MDNLLLLNKLEGVLGKGIKTSRGNYSFYCPKCKHRKRKLEVQINTNERGENPFHCWTCGDKLKGKKLKNLFFALNIPSDQTKDFDSYITVVKTKKRKYDNVELPNEFKSLASYGALDFSAKEAIDYLSSRGITRRDIIRYNIGYCTYGKYQNMLIFPSYDENLDLNYFIARSFKTDWNPYIKPDLPADIIFYEHLINWNLPIILCEGVFDAIAIRRNAIPLLGKSIPKILKKKIITSNVDKIYVALDNDAKDQSLQHCIDFMNQGKEVYFLNLNDKDPSKMGFHSFTQYVQTVKPLTFNTLLEYKLFKHA